jgi:hypothetical protein
MAKKFKRYGSAAVQKGRWAAQQIAKRSAAILFVMIIMVGILIPTGVGLMIDKMGDIGVDTLVASSSDTNSSVILGKMAQYWNGQYIYKLDVVTMDGYDYTMTDNKRQVGSCNGVQVYYCWIVNASKLEDVDSIVIYYNSVDGCLTNTSGRFIFRSSRGDIYYTNPVYDNKSGCYKFKVPVTPAMLLKSSGDSKVRIYIDGLNCVDGNPLGRTYKARIELYNTKGISANSTKTAFLAGTGVLMLITGVFATPWVNPTRWMKKKGWF